MKRANLEIRNPLSVVTSKQCWVHPTKIVAKDMEREEGMKLRYLWNKIDGTQ